MRFRNMFKNLSNSPLASRPSVAWCRMEAQTAIINKLSLTDSQRFNAISEAELSVYQLPIVPNVRQQRCGIQAENVEPLQAIQDDGSLPVPGRRAGTHPFGRYTPRLNDCRGVRRAKTGDAQGLVPGCAVKLDGAAWS